MPCGAAMRLGVSVTLIEQRPLISDAESLAEPLSSGPCGDSALVCKIGIENGYAATASLLASHVKSDSRRIRRLRPILRLGRCPASIARTTVRRETASFSAAVSKPSKVSSALRDIFFVASNSRCRHKPRTRLLCHDVTRNRKSRATCPQGFRPFFYR
jgi:hypothetical protein